MKRLLSVTIIIILVLIGTASLTGCSSVSSIVSSISTDDTTDTTDSSTEDSSTVSYGLNAAMLGIALTSLNEEFDDLKDTITALQEEDSVFTDDQWDTLQSIVGLKSTIVTQVSYIIDLNSDTVTLDDVEYLYDLAQSAYATGYDLVEEHWSDFDTTTQDMLLSFQSDVESTEKRIETLLDDPDDESINETLVLIIDVLSTAVKLVSAVASL